MTTPRYLAATCCRRSQIETKAHIARPTKARTIRSRNWTAAEMTIIKNRQTACFGGVALKRDVSPRT